MMVMRLTMRDVGKAGDDDVMEILLHMLTSPAPLHLHAGDRTNVRAASPVPHFNGWSALG
jgi:hypothetical protein